MAWIYPRKTKQGATRWRLFDRIEGKVWVVVRNLGVHKALATISKVNYEKALSMGFTFTPPIKVADIENFLRAKREGLDAPNIDRRITIEEMLDLYAKHHGPSLKGGVTSRYGSAYYNLEKRLVLFRRFWPGKYADEFHKLDIRDFLAQYNNIGTQMRYLGALGKLFKAFSEWNEENILGFQVRLPRHNPATKWRNEMKPAQKREVPDRRVLSPEEWHKFRVHLKPRTLAICEMALFRFMRKADISAPLKVSNGNLHGVQQKTGDVFSVPVLANQPEKYDFTNFKRDFQNAQKAAGMDWPAGHDLHFSFKDLRRTGAMWGYRHEKDLVGVHEFLGHRDIKTTKRYLNITDADKHAIAAAVEKLGGYNQGKIRLDNEGAK